MENISKSFVHFGKTEQIGQQIINNYVDDAALQNAVRVVLEEFLSPFLSSTPNGIIEKVRAIASSIVADKFQEVILHIDDKFQSEADLRKALQQKLATIDPQAIVQELRGEFEILSDKALELIKNLERLCRDAARKAEEAFAAFVKEFAEIKTITEEFKAFRDNIRLDLTYELSQGWEELRQGKFGKAKEFFDKASERTSTEADAYFGKYLADCKIQVLWDCVNCRWQPIFHDASADFDNNAYYNSAIHYAQEDRKKEFEEFYEEIKYTMREFEKLDEDDNVEDYDCFICVKITDNDGNYTKDNNVAYNIFTRLEKQGYKPFYSEVQLTYATGKAYEAHILYALYKAKCMIVVCSDKEYLKTPWVKNEYTRYIDMMKSGDKDEDSICIVYGKTKISKLPGMRRELQNIPTDGDTTLKILDFVKEFADPDKGATPLPKIDDEERKAREEAERKAKEKSERKAREEAERKSKEESEKSAKKQTPLLPADYPTLETYDRTEFEIINSALKKYKGRKKQVKIPYGVKDIADKAFYGYRRLTSITIPNSVTSIGNSAFSGCRSLTSITIPNSVTSIGAFAFSRCTCLTSISIPDSVTSINWGAFSFCTGFTSITIPNSVTDIERGAFEGCTGLRSITIPDSVTNIETEAFKYCTGLRSISIPNSVTSIDSWTFENCTGLTSITIPNSVTNIAFEAFKDCTGLRAITISNSVTDIRERAFEKCNALKTVYFEGSSEQWDDITIGIDNDILINAKRYYFSEKPLYDGQHWHWDENTHTPVVWTRTKESS